MADSPISVLLIEDNPELSRSLRAMLASGREPGFSTEACADLSSGLDRLAKGDINVALLDLTLSDSIGFDTFSQLFARYPDVPVVVLTALGDENLAFRCLREGAQDYVLKNEINPSMLARAIRYSIERKRGEEARSRLAAIVESSQDAIIGMSLEGLIVSWNTGAERIFGHAFEEVIGRSIDLLLPTTSSGEVSTCLKRLCNGEYMPDFEAACLRKDGQSFYAELNLSPIKSSAGRTIGASMIARDVDDRRRAQQERERLIQSLQAALAHVKTLSGLLPICSSCKKIRDDHGYWTQVEVYVKAHSGAEFTHGICPECADLYKAEMSRKL